jgi:hypothetical protein
VEHEEGEENNRSHCHDRIRDLENVALRIPGPGLLGDGDAK